MKPQISLAPASPILRCTKTVDRKGIRHERCGLAAAEYSVSGNSYSCRAVLCERHKQMAQREGFSLKAVVSTR
jgi:hypothetical protein